MRIKTVNGCMITKLIYAHMNKRTHINVLHIHNNSMMGWEFLLFMATVEKTKGMHCVNV